MQAKEYRPDIDVLRAIAVLSVIFYHAHFSLFSGGYVGVSIFFVISGYLITGIIKRKLENGTFSFWEFYENRVRRILPALFVMMLFFALLYYFLSMQEIFDLQRSIRRAMFGLANIFFYKNTGYFDVAAETMPLLHTWSLGVEEQFYFIFPLLLFTLNMYLYKTKRLKITHVLWTLFALSFVFSVIFVFYNQKFTFYMLPTRAWELLCGSLLAYTGATPASQKGKSLCILAGLGLMFGSVFFYDDVLFPGFWALPPCLGAVLYIAGGTGYTFSNRKNLIHVLTNNKVLVFIGVISYSLYLWHWPVFVFYTAFPILKPITVPAACGLIPLIFVISYLSWRFVEKPVRQLPLFKNRKVLWTATLVCMGCFFTMATYMRYPKVYGTYTVTSYEAFTAMPKPDSSVKGKIPVDFIFIGDSHKLSNQKLFQMFAEKYHLTGATMPNILIRNAVRGNDLTRVKRYLSEWDGLTALYNTYTSKNLFIMFRYAQKLNGKDRYYTQDKEYPLVYLPNRKLTPKQGFLQALRDMLDEALANGIEHIYIQTPVPEPKDSIPHKATMLTVFMEYSVAKINARLGEKLAEYQARNKDVFDVFAQLKEEYPQIEFVDIAPYLLNTETQQFAVMNDKELFYYDDDHLSLEGTLQHYAVYDKIFAQIAAEKKAAEQKNAGAPKTAQTDTQTNAQ